MIEWMAKNRVTANLVMLFFIIGGVLFSMNIRQEVFPEISLDTINVTVPYPGASPEEVERGVLLSIEDQVRGIDGVKSVKSFAFEGRGQVQIELLRGVNGDRAVQDVKNEVDSILSFPKDAERPVVTLLQARSQVISLVLWGDMNQITLRELAEKVRYDLIQEEGITQVEFIGGSPYEINIELPQQTLRTYNLTLDNVAGIIGRTALEIPGGGVKTPGGEILLRTQERRDFASEFGDISIISNANGTKVRLEDIANIQEGFAETDIESFFNGKPAIQVAVFRVGEQSPLDISDAVNAYANKLEQELPRGAHITVWQDLSQLFEGRIDLLQRNAAIGLVLVLILLGFFLDLKLAFWVTLGIPTSIIGSFMLFPMFGATINMISLFAFIVTLGIIVDDAVVVGEHIYKKLEEGLEPLQAAIIGAKEMAMPVTFAVLTNIAAFFPLFFIPGPVGKFFMQIPAIVVAVFFVSLIESLFILPAHLTHAKPRKKKMGRKLDVFIEKIYAPVLNFTLRNKMFTISVGLSILIVSLGSVLGGIVQFYYMPRIDSDYIFAQAELPFGAPMSEARAMQKVMVERAQEILDEQEGDIALGIYTLIGQPLIQAGPNVQTVGGGGGSHLVGVQVVLVPSDEREIGGIEFARRWEKAIGRLPGLETLQFKATTGAGAGKAIDINVQHPDPKMAEEAAKKLASALEDYSGVSQVDNGVNLGKVQYNFKLKPEGLNLGLTVQGLARQVRSSFYGAEALRQQRGRNEIKVLVRLPETERSSSYTVEELILRTPGGKEIPLFEAAEVTEGRAYTDIRRSDGRRIVAISADVDETRANANNILADLEENTFPALIQEFPGLSYSLEGQQKDQKESLGAMATGFALALFAIYTLLAIPFKSYVQPLIVMLSIPFGIIGAVLGHLILGYDFSLISLFGIIALSGVVVNDSLVLIVSANEKKRVGIAPVEAISLAAKSRFRPILLTSLTTFFGLAPMIFERSLQARFLIPMAISLGFGILFATFIVLLIVPAIYLSFERDKADNS